MYDHQDILHVLNENIPVKEKLVSTHKALEKYFPFVARIAIAIYDPATTILKTYLHSSGDAEPLSQYQTLLDDAPSLKKVLNEGRPRIINNLLTFEDGTHEHTRRIGREGYASSYTMPMFNNGVFYGFVFFNSYEKDAFAPDVLYLLDIVGHLLSLMVISEIESVRLLTAAVTTTGNMSHVRDPETGSHLDRMSRYSRLIAMKLADRYDLDDAYIEHIFMFSPLHDLGKIGIPDKILLKKGKLTDNEMAIMRTHARKGREMIDDVLRNFSLENVDYVNILRNIAEFHHEAVNGGGYPEGRVGDDIPLEARIVAVADVFDALTSRRSYKEAWSNDAAFAFLETIAGETLDRECVDILVSERQEVEKIQRHFVENSLG